MLKETEGNRLVIGRVLQLSHLLQKVIFALYLSSAIVVVAMPVVLWLVLAKKTLMFVFFVPGFDETTTEGFLLHVALHAFMMPAAFCGYTAQECLFLAFFMPVAACVDAFGNEVEELNSMLKLEERDDRAIRDQLNRIVKLHQLLNEYEAMLEKLYSLMFLNKVGLIYLGIISAIVVILKSNDRMAYIFFALQFEQLTQSCLMGTIVTVKNDQLMDHLYDINWYQLTPDQAKDLRFILHRAQSPTSVTIGKYAPLNLESYKRIVKSIYTYVMILVTLLE
ncbi:hypothetical protein pipiens_009578 [Culex pipiens pipiens]|uniref:Odorant receptor n=1 Tax=Culex pipiens pipiens TaxID=38569 RepID=A0ABD1DDE6_CULPP